jgi:hypothetical protein
MQAKNCDRCRRNSLRGQHSIVPYTSHPGGGFQVARTRSHALRPILRFKGRKPERTQEPPARRRAMTISPSIQRPGPELGAAKYVVGTKLECSLESAGSPGAASPLPEANVVALDSSPRDRQSDVGPPFPFRHSQPLQLVLPLACPPPDHQRQHGFVPKLPPKPVPMSRCSEKGCVFPAAAPQGRCLQHQRQWSEPGFYSSHQPTSALVEQGRFGPVRPEWVKDPKAGRAYDRRRMAAEREVFLREQQ